jgi:tRNA-splicing ligase RtcB
VLRKQIMRGIRERIPLGMDHHKEAQDEKYLPVGHDIDSLEVVKRRSQSILHEVGTLGGGNHFIELQKDEEGNLWIMIHSGSRNLGKQVGDYYNKIASKLNKRWHSSVSPEIQLPFLARETKEFGMYWSEMKYCIDFALCNRKLMMERIEEVIADSLKGIEFEPMINIAHNYAAWENHFGQNVIVHRKGATLAREGIIGIMRLTEHMSVQPNDAIGSDEELVRQELCLVRARFCARYIIRYVACLQFRRIGLVSIDIDSRKRQVKTCH